PGRVVLEQVHPGAAFLLAVRVRELGRSRRRAWVELSTPWRAKLAPARGYGERNARRLARAGSAPRRSLGGHASAPASGQRGQRAGRGGGRASARELAWQRMPTILWLL